MAIGIELLQRWIKPETTDKRLILEEINTNVCKAAKSTMIMIHHFGILYSEEVIALLSKDNILSSLITSCNSFNKV